jgi:NADPH:quinone reductase-like Zn-dependent oxidoreductase
VLLHFSTVGNGQAALALAENIGAEIFVTWGADEERRVLLEDYNISPSHVLPSEAGSLVAARIFQTNGQGVDVMLSSVTGPLLKAA